MSGRWRHSLYMGDGVEEAGMGGGVLRMRLRRHRLRLSACLSLCLVCGFTPLPTPPPTQPNPPLLTGLSSNVPQDSVNPAVFKIQFRCTIQICLGEQRGRQTHYVGEKNGHTSPYGVVACCWVRKLQKINAIMAEAS